MEINIKKNEEFRKVIKEINFMLILKKKGVDREIKYGRIVLWMGKSFM